MEFEDWLFSKDLSPSTVKKYAGAIDGSLTKWALEHKITSKPLRQVRDRDEFDEIAELIGGTEIFTERNERGNHMYGAALNSYAMFLGRNDDAMGDTLATGGPFAHELAKIEQGEADLGLFVPDHNHDARERVLRAIVRRRGQPKFRSSLVAAYEARCAITHCPVLAILEAAHVTPYLGPQTNSVSNGLLLRADIHTLWDLGLIAIDPNSMQISVSPTLSDPLYQALAGQPVFQPVEIASRPSYSALTQQWNLFLAHLVKALAV